MKLTQNKTKVNMRNELLVTFLHVITKGTNTQFNRHSPLSRSALFGFQLVTHELVLGRMEPFWFLGLLVHHHSVLGLWISDYYGHLIQLLDISLFLMFDSWSFVQQVKRVRHTGITACVSVGLTFERFLRYVAPFWNITL